MAAKEYTPGAIASAAMSMNLALVEMLVTNGILKKDETIAAVLQIADSKLSKAALYNSADEADASEILTSAAQRLDERLK